MGQRWPLWWRHSGDWWSVEPCARSTRPASAAAAHPYRPCGAQERARDSAHWGQVVHCMLRQAARNPPGPRAACTKNSLSVHHDVIIQRWLGPVTSWRVWDPIPVAFFGCSRRRERWLSAGRPGCLGCKSGEGAALRGAPGRGTISAGARGVQSRGPRELGPRNTEQHARRAGLTTARRRRGEWAPGEDSGVHVQLSGACCRPSPPALVPVSAWQRISCSQNAPSRSAASGARPTIDGPPCLQKLCGCWPWAGGVVNPQVTEQVCSRMSEPVPIVTPGDERSALGA